MSFKLAGLLKSAGFQNDVILVQLREKRRNLPLAEGVVERLIDHLRGDAQARRR